MYIQRSIYKINIVNNTLFKTADCIYILYLLCSFNVVIINFHIIWFCLYTNILFHHMSIKICKVLFLYIHTMTEPYYILYYI